MRISIIGHIALLFRTPNFNVNFPVINASWHGFQPRNDSTRNVPDRKYVGNALVDFVNVLTRWASAKGWQFVSGVWILFSVEMKGKCVQVTYWMKAVQVLMGAADLDLKSLIIEIFLILKNHLAVIWPDQPQSLIRLWSAWESTDVETCYRSDNFIPGIRLGATQLV